MSRPDKKQRHKAKREAKRREMRRREGISPVTRLAEAPGEIDCWMSDDLAGFGQAQIFIYKRAAGLSGIASFLVDRGVVGLKDAWTQMNVDRAEFRNMIDSSESRGIPMRRATLDDARCMIAGAIRWAYEHGMRLPKDWAKPASLLGGVGDWAKADVSAFAKEFAGHPEDLRQRLISEPFDTFVQRTDIQFIFSNDAPYTDQDTGEYVPGIDDEDDEDDLETDAADLPVEELAAVREQLTPAATALAAQTADWLTARGETPSPELGEAWLSLILATMVAKTAKPNASSEEMAELIANMLGEVAGRTEELNTDTYTSAVHQIIAHYQADAQTVHKTLETMLPRQ